MIMRLNGGETLERIRASVLAEQASATCKMSIVDLDTVSQRRNVRFLRGITII